MAPGPGTVGEIPHHLAAIINPLCCGPTSVGNINSGEVAAAVQKATVSVGVGDSPYDLATAVDSVGAGAMGAGVNDRGK